MLPIREFKEYYLSGKKLDPTRLGANSYSIKMHEFFNDVFENKSEECSPIQVDQSLISLIQEKFDPNNQQDCHEFLIHILNNLQNEENKDENNKPLK